jgi:hypothetical protein
METALTDDQIIEVLVRRGGGAALCRLKAAQQQGDASHLLECVTQVAHLTCQALRQEAFEGLLDEAQVSAGLLSEVGAVN